MIKKQTLLGVIGFAAAAFALPASAQVSMGSAYFGGSLGKSHFTNVCTNGAGSCKSRDTAFSLFGGYQFTPSLGIELGFNDFGHATVADTEIKGDAWEFSAVGTLPVGGALSLFGKLGGYHGEMKGGGVAERKNGVTYGWGVQYDFTRSFGLRGQWQRFADMGGGNFGAKTDVDVLGLAVLWRMQ